jgi:hypothetical protein
VYEFISKRNPELRRCCTHRTSDSNVQVTSFELANAKDTDNHENEDEQKPEVVNQAPDAEHRNDGGIVGAEVGQVVVDTALDLY